MRSWTAEVVWEEDPSSRDRIADWTGALEQNAGRIRLDEDARTLTATVTLDAATLAEALPVALQLVEGVVGRETWLWRIAAADAYT